MHEVHPGLLWIGHAMDVRDPQSIFDVGISAVIDVAYEETPSGVPRQLVYCRFPLNDGGGNEPGRIVQALKTTTDFLRSGTKTMVACSAGMSRSPSIAAFSLALHLSERPEDVLERIGKLKSLEINTDLWNEIRDAIITIQ
ncbi:MAG: dual specificity protein phosphatase [Planctomycetota bacterium]